MSLISNHLRQSVVFCLDNDVTRAHKQVVFRYICILIPLYIFLFMCMTMLVIARGCSGVHQSQKNIDSRHQTSSYMQSTFQYTSCIPISFPLYKDRTYINTCFYFTLKFTPVCTVLDLHEILQLFFHCLLNLSSYICIVC